jgi:hypothetical protein
MTRAEEAWVTELLSEDIDDIVRTAEHLTTAQKLAKVRLIALIAPSLGDQLAVVKASSFVQAVLGSLSTKVVPVGTATAVVDAVASLTDVSLHVPDVRRVAYNVLALVFLRARVLTPSLDERIRTAFKRGKRDPHPGIRDFSRNTGRDVLSQREPAAAAFNAPVSRTAAYAYRSAGRAAKRMSGKRTRRSSSRPRSTT